MTELVIGDRYEVQGELGAGTGGIIYLGKDRMTDEKVAIKHFQKARTTGTRPALNEASTILGLSHPHIVKCLNFSYLGAGELYLVYELIEGGTLRDVLEKTNIIEVSKALEIIRQVLYGLEHLHGRGFIHCDLKPENIFCHEKHGEAVYKIGDLGVAQFLDSLDCDQKIAGSPAYMAPERLFESFTFNSDLYSLGVVLYEMIAGKRPFDGGPAELAKAHLREPVDYSIIRDPRVKDFLSSLLDKNPRYRLAKASLAIHVVEDLLDDRPSDFTALREAKVTRAPFAVPKKKDDLTPIGSFDVDLKFENIMALNSSQRPILGIDYGSYMELVDGTSGAALNFKIPNIGLCVQAVTPSTLLYSTNSRICAMNVKFQEEITLVNDSMRVFGLFSSDDLSRVLWADAKNANFLDLKSNQSANFPCQNFGLNAHLRFVGKDKLLFTTGPVKPKINIASLAGEILHQIDVEGPIIDITHGPNEFLLLTLSPDDSTEMVMYYIDDELNVASKPLPSQVESYIMTRSSLLVLFRNGNLNTYSGAFDMTAIKGLAKGDSGRRTMLASLDNQFVFLTSEKNNRTKITCFENHESI